MRIKLINILLGETFFQFQKSSRLKMQAVILLQLSPKRSSAFYQSFLLKLTEKRSLPLPKNLLSLKTVTESIALKYKYKVTGGINTLKFSIKAKKLPTLMRSGSPGAIPLKSIYMMKILNILL